VKTPLRDIWHQINPKIQGVQGVQPPRYRIALFGGCLVDFVYPEQARALFPLLEEQGVQLDYPEDQTCCGLPAKMMGEKETAREVAIQNLKAMRPDDYDYILTLCASCGSHMKENYPRLLDQESRWYREAEHLKEKIVDVSSLMVNILQIKPVLAPGRKPKVAYHAPCHLCRGLGVTREPRELMGIAGLEYTPAREEEVCCGFGGSYSLEFPELSAELLRRKLDNVEATGAKRLVTDCPGCVLQLRGGLDKRDGGIKVQHIAEAVSDRRKGRPF